MDNLAFALAILSDEDLTSLADILVTKYENRASRLEFLLGVAAHEKMLAMEEVCDIDA